MQAKLRVRSTLIVVIAGLALAGCSAGTFAGFATPRSHDHTSETKPIAVPERASSSTGKCPLTGTPARGGTDPSRPALAIKVDNYPDARPQNGLDKADLVFEEPVEGMITRYVAIYQCQDATLVGPIRSARAIDVGILSQLGSPLLVHAGGITPVVDRINQSSIVNVDIGSYGSVVQGVPGRQAPYDTYASTQALWNLESSDHAAPAPLFTYSGATPTGTPSSSLSVPFSSTSNVVWNYSTSRRTWLRYYGSTPDLLADGTQNSATNVVVQTIHVTYGPWLENDLGDLEVQANMDGSGPVAVFRNGVEATGKWSRASLSSPTQLVDNNGHGIALAPGNTWIELVPDTVPWSTGATTSAAPSGPSAPTASPPPTS